MYHSPIAENLPLRHYQPSPSPLASSASPPSSVHNDPEYTAALCWMDISVIYKKFNKKVLDGITGFAEPYRMLSVMGPSKSGKSTLLQTISGRLSNKAKYEGDIRINGRRQQLTYGTSAFLTADDDMLPDNLTVKEHLTLSALLRLPSTLSYKEKLAIANHVMCEMGLTELSYRYIRRRPVNGLTAVQRRILNLAVEILIGPCIIYFDDAFKGLEGAAALSLLIKLKGLSRGGCTVIMCIEHISSHIYELLDDICILGSSKMIYFGDSISALEHFERAGFPCPSFHNPGDHFLYTIGAEFYVQNEDSHQIVHFLCASFQSSEFNTSLMTKVNTLLTKKGGILVNKTKHPSFMTEITILSYRILLNTMRIFGFYWMRIILAFLLMISIGTIFLRLDHSTRSVQARASCIFLALEGMFFLSVAGVPYLYKEIQIHIQEMVNCQYGVYKYMVANTVASLPFLLLVSLVPLCTMYFLVGLNPGVTKFTYFVINLYLSLITSESLMMAITSLLPNIHTGMITGACVQVLFMLVGGYIRHPNHLPSIFWKFPLSYVSFHAHSYRQMFENQFMGTQFGGHSGYFIIYDEYHMPLGPGKWWTLLILAGMGIFYRMLAVIFIHFTYPLNK